MLQQINSHFEPLVERKEEVKQVSSAVTTKKAGPTLNVWDSMKMDQHIGKVAAEKKLKVRHMMEEHYPLLVDYYNRTDTPWPLVEALKEVKINGGQIKDFGGPGFTNLEFGAMAYELARFDASFATFYVVHNAIGQNVVEAIGDEEQRRRILTETMNMDRFICFGLTEPDFGSDASSLQTTATKVEGGYLLNGQKRWIGNAPFADYIIIWARNEDDGNRVQAFVATKGSKGLDCQKIQNKYSLRIV